MSEVGFSLLWFQSFNISGQFWVSVLRKHERSKLFSPQIVLWLALFSNVPRRLHIPTVEKKGPHSFCGLIAVGSALDSWADQCLGAEWEVRGSKVTELIWPSRMVARLRSGCKLEQSARLRSSSETSSAGFLLRPQGVGEDLGATCVSWPLGGWNDPFTGVA